ncbi:MAG: class I SAM-dependent methyltransferase [Desulfocapsaceae bacterium]|jgi:predicted O-methyltransferase YrrM|nr:class I SAM-dependent methyltransferase [Desulfocapsaceae bacterium]
MKFKEISAKIDGIPYIMPEMASDLYTFIISNRPAQCLELGFAHGASSCYIAAALDELGSGRLTSVDLISAASWQKPSIEELLEKTGLAGLVDVHREHTGYNWFLKKKIMEHTANNDCTPVYDLCFIDGPKNWTIDGAAFFLVDKLLKPGGWVVFDDLQWTYKKKIEKGKTKSDGVSLLELGPDEIDQPHIELIFQLLVMQHPDYSNFLVKDNWWAWAQKTPHGNKQVTFRNSKEYLERLHAWETRFNRKHRRPFEPFSPAKPA